VALDSTSLTVGGSGRGTVTLTTPAPAIGASLTLTSSNPGVATVQTPVAIASGASSATFNVVAVAAGTATITAAYNGSSRQSPVLTVFRSAALASISLSASTIVGGNSVTATVSLTSAAPAGGALVSLSATEPLLVPDSILVPAATSSTSFTVLTRAVGGSLSGTITGSYGGASASAALMVTRPTVATARFGVTGPTETETCTMASDGRTMNCTFNGSTSTAPGNIVAWDWSFGVASMVAQTTSGPVLSMPAVDCSLLPPPPLPAGTSWFNLVVTLKIHDDLGNVSPEAVDRSARLLPQGACGF
jgi:hypothetical protein